MRSFHHYLPLDEELFHDGFYVTGAGQGRVAPGSPYPPRPHPSFYQFSWREGRVFPEFALVLITGGQGQFESRETGLRPVRRGDAFLLFPGVWHRYRPAAKTGWTEKWVQFNGAFFHQLRERGLLSPARALQTCHRFDEVVAALDALLLQIGRQPGRNTLHYALHVVQLLALLLDPPPEAAARALPPMPGPAAGAPLIAAAENYIWTHSQRDLSVRDVAAHLGVSRRTLERRLKEALGRTVLEEIARCRFNRAERLLRETRLPVKSVVHLAGFGRAEAMRQAFLKRTGRSPRAYRAA